VEKEEKE